MRKIRILVITSRYPPYHLGGYEIRSKDVIDELQNRGYKILVITSKKETLPKSSLQIPQYKIHRRLDIRRNSRHFFSEIISDFFNMKFLDRHVKEFRPDVIYLGHIIDLSKALMPYLAGLETPIVYDEGGIGLIHSWEKRGRWFYFIEQYVSKYSSINKLKPLVANAINRSSGNKIKTQWVWPRNMHIFFNSHLNYENALTRNVPINGAKVFHSGIDANEFSFVQRSSFNMPLSIIVPGRLEPHKGQKDAVELLDCLRRHKIDGNITFIGEQYSSYYCSEVIKLLEETHLEEKVRFLPMLGHQELIHKYHVSDVCFFPSYHKTGFSRIPLEAMACGCIVFSYGNEGSNEVIKNEQNGYIVPNGNIERIAEHIIKMISNPELVENMAYTARKEIEQNHGMQKYIDKIEAVINDAVK